MILSRTLTRFGLVAAAAALMLTLGLATAGSANAQEPDQSHMAAILLTGCQPPGAAALEVVKLDPLGTLPNVETGKEQSTLISWETPASALDSVKRPRDTLDFVQSYSIEGRSGLNVTFGTETTVAVTVSNGAVSDEFDHNGLPTQNDRASPGTNSQGLMTTNMGSIAFVLVAVAVILAVVTYRVRSQMGGSTSGYNPRE